MIEPLTPDGCNLQDFAFMPLDVARLRDSDLASDETPEACWAAVLLWAASWHQVPAASIPNSDQWQAKQAGYVSRGRIDPAWARVRTGALRGWVECSDGRLYHPVVAEKAREAWQAKLEQRWRTECGRIKKHNDRHEGANVPKPTYEEWLSLGCPTGQPLYVPRDTDARPKDVPGETPSKGQGEGQGQGQINKEDTVPDGTGGEPPFDPTAMSKSDLWKAGKSLLREQGMPMAQCGTFIGKLVKDHGEDNVLQAVQVAIVNRPAGAADYLVGVLRNAAKPTKTTRADRRADTLAGLTGNHQGAPDANHRADAIDVQARVIPGDHTGAPGMGGAGLFPAGGADGRQGG